MAKKPVQDRSRERVDRMVSTFGQLLDKVGFDAVTTTMVAKESGSAVGSVYQFFRNKGELADALRDRLAANLVFETLANLESFANQASAKDRVTLVGCLVALHQAMETVHRKEAGAMHMPVLADRIAQELTEAFDPYTTLESELLYSYVLVAVASSAACCKAALADSTHGSDIMGLCQWSLQELGKGL